MEAHPSATRPLDACAGLPSADFDPLASVEVRVDGPCAGAEQYEAEADQAAREMGAVELVRAESEIAFGEGLQCACERSPPAWNQQGAADESGDLDP